MPIQTLILKPGIDVESTKILSGASWNNSNLIRFRDGLAEKLGGWQHVNTNAFVGTARGIHAWADLAGNPYVGLGTDQRLEVFSGGTFFDITPLRATHNFAPAFTTTSGSATIQIHDTAHGANVGDWIDILVPVSVGGLILQGFYLVTAVIDANNYQILAASLATASVAAGGAVPAFTTTAASPNISVLLSNHGLTAASSFQVQVATTVGGIAMSAGSTYALISVTDANHFVIAPGTIAVASTTVSENGGNAQIQYLIPSGLASATLTSGYGVGPYGGGPYGGANTSSLPAPLRQWFLGNWGQDLIGNYNGSPIYVWQPPVGFGNVALAIDTTNFPSAADPPAQVNSSFVALPQQQMFALGASPVGGGAIDPNLVRFSDVGDFTDWTPTATNQAGSYRIPSGSRIVGGCASNNFSALWTDIDFWQMSYLGFPLVWGFQKLASGCGLLAARAYGLYKSNIYWASRDQFMVFDGSTVQILPCTVWDQFFYNLDAQQVDKVFTAVNSEFGEVTWFYPSAGGNGEVDSYVTYSAYESQRGGAPIWYYGSLVRTCWTDVNVYGGPLGTDTNGNLQQHEVGYDADGVAMVPSITTGYITISDGTLFTTIRRLIPDMLLTGGTAPFNTITITIDLLNYPTDTPRTIGPFTWSPQTPEFILTMCRARLVSFTISSTGLGVFWRIGAFRYDSAPSGRR